MSVLRGARNGWEIVLGRPRARPKFFFRPQEAAKRDFCPLQLPIVFRTRGLRSSGAILGPILASKMVFFWPVVLVLLAFFFELFLIVVLLLVPFKKSMFQALLETSPYGFRPTKTDGFSRFLHLRAAAGHAARKVKESQQ